MGLDFVLVACPLTVHVVSERARGPSLGVDHESFLLQLLDRCRKPFSVHVSVHMDYLTAV